MASQGNVWHSPYICQIFYQSQTFSWLFVSEKCTHLAFSFIHFPVTFQAKFYWPAKKVCDTQQALLSCLSKCYQTLHVRNIWVGKLENKPHPSIRDSTANHKVHKWSTWSFAFVEQRNNYKDIFNQILCILK